MSEDFAGAAFEPRRRFDQPRAAGRGGDAQGHETQDDWVENGQMLLPVLRALLGAFGADSWLARHNRIEDLCFDWLEFRSLERQGTLRDFVDVLISHESAVSDREPGVLRSLALRSISAAIRPAFFPPPALRPVTVDVWETAHA